MDLSDIQGLVLRAYRRLPHAAYVLLRFQPDPQRVQAWLRALVVSDSIDSATQKDVGPDGRPGIRLNVAFTYTGLEKLGLSENALSTFPAAFAEGLGQSDQDHRSRVLGDLGNNRPTEWEWGCQDPRRDTAVDAVLMIFATDVGVLHKEVFRWTGAARVFDAIANGQRVLFGDLPDDLNEPTSEPFGFRDGISQPVLRGARAQLPGDDRQPPIHEIADGEILLGHRDGAQLRTLSPTVAAAEDRRNVLPPVKDDVLADPSVPIEPRKDLGYNGTYLVFRQLEQNVGLFRDETTRYAAALGISEERFGAMLVGRWPDGSPLVKCPVAPDPLLGSGPAANDFGFRDDLHGDRCPMGSHIRRANPRDSLTDDPQQSWTVANRHRLLRRGRPYHIGDRQGLYFICLNADIVRQFEFVQQNWIMGDSFEGLEDEDDPLIGARQLRAAAGVMTLPPPPENRVKRKVAGLQQYVTVRGGAYFFLPSMTALRYLAGAGPANRPPRQAWQPAPAPLTWRERVRFVFLARFPLLLAAVLAAFPLLLRAGPALPALARPMFQVGRWWEVVPVTALASLAASVALMTYRIVELYAAMRVGSRAPGGRALTWARVLLWQSVSLPIVATMVWMSAADAAGERWRSLLWFGGAAAGGYAVAFAVLFLAAALRNRSVRPGNRDDGGFLPPSRALRSLKNAQAPQIPVASTFFRYVETNAGAWPQDIGSGYIDHERSQILPGHVAAMVFVLTLLAIYLLGWFVLFPPRLRLGVQLPPMTYLLFELLIGGWVAASAAFFLDRYRVPLLTILLAWVLLSASSNTDHQFEIGVRTIVAPPSVESVIRSADDYDAAHGGVDSRNRPIIVVAAGGGGIHQAAWTARVLTGLTDLWGGQFAGGLRFISGASAGSVGALHYLNEFGENKRPRGLAEGGDLRRVVAAAEASATGDVWWGIAYPDLFRAVVPLVPGKFVPSAWDRGWALEQSWSRAFGRRSDDETFTIGTWRRDAAAGWRPAFAFNAMVVETGQRVILGTHEPDANANSPGATKGVSAVTNGQDLSLITAARLSASFPFITPFARPMQMDRQPKPALFHLTDGGYWDNYGVVSVLEWLREAKGRIGTRPVLVVQIPPSPDPPVAERDQSWVWQLTAPLVALASVRVNAQKARNELEIEQLKASWCTDCITFVKIPYVGGGLSPETLSWHLSRAERCAIEQSWRKYERIAEPLTLIAKVLGPPARTDPPLPGECR